MAVARTRPATSATASATQARRPALQQASQPPARSVALRSTAPPAVTLGPPASGPVARRQAVMSRLRNAAARQQGPASSPAAQQQASREASAEASRAAPSPANEARAQAQAGQAEVMNQQRPGSVQQNTFLELVERQLNAVPMPRNPEEMDRFRQNNSAGGLRQQLQGSVGEQAAQAQNNIRSAAEAQPAAGQNRQPDSLPQPAGPPAGGNLRAQEILPQPRTERETSFDASRQQVEGQMRENNLTQESLREANDPRFSAVQEARENVHEQAARAPEEYRAAEQAELQRQENAIARDEQSATREMSADRERANSQIATQQRRAMTREEAERRQVSERIERMFTEAQTRVQQKLTWLDGEVDRRFTEGEARAKQMFEAFVEEAMYQWKLRRYGRWLFVPGVGAAYALGRWVADKFIDLNQFPEIRAIYENGKQLYLRKMRELIVEIAGVVESSLRWCTDEIARARQQIQDYVNSLPQALRRVGEESSRGVSERFDQLRNSVNERREALANRLVERYRQAQQQLDQRIQQMQAANRGLINRFVAAIREVIEILNNFRRQLMSLVGEARSVIDRIVQRPIPFLRNLVRALRMGFDQFSRNIVAHLRSALLEWLFGTLAQAGIQMPQSFDLRSIIGLILQILGISYDRIRGKVARIIGERNMAILEHAWRYVSALIREGPIGLWNEIRNDLSSLWDMALQAVREWVISQLVRAAITRLVSMFNPVGAIIQAVLMIYNTVMFFVEKIQQIMELVRTIVRSLDKIIRGDLADAANWVENAMARTLPIIIAFLARLLGLSGIADRIREFITGIQARVDRTIDAALERVVGSIRRLFGRGGQQGGPDNRTPEEKARALHTALTEAEAITGRSGATPEGVRRQLPQIQQRHRLRTLNLVPQQGNTFRIHGEINPDEDKTVTLGDAQAPDGSMERPYWIKWHKRATANLEPLTLRLDPSQPARVTVRATERREVTVWQTPAEAVSRLEYLRLNIPIVQRNLALTAREAVGVRGSALEEAQRELAQEQQSTAHATAKAKKRAVQRLKNAVNRIISVQNRTGRELPAMRERLEREVAEEASLSAQMSAGDPFITTTEWIGVTPGNQIRVNRQVGPRRLSPSRRREREFMEFLRRADGDVAGKSPDHVTELSLSGPDSFENLWPIAENPIPSQRINPHTGKQVGVGFEGAGEESEAQNLTNYFIGKYFIIKGFQS